MMNDARADRNRAGMWPGAFAGVVAAMVVSALVLFGARHWQGVHVAQILSDRLTIILPLDVFREGLERLESNAKPITLVALTLLQVAVGALLGAVYARAFWRTRQARLAGAFVLGLLIWCALSFVVAPLGGIGVLGRDHSGGLLRAQITFLGVAAGFLVLLVVLMLGLTGVQRTSDPSRRSFMRLAGTSVMAVPALVASVYIGRFANSLRRDAPATITTTQAQKSPFAFPGMPPEITPNKDFYIVSKNFIDPSVDETGWTLEVGGLVERPLSFTYADVLNRPWTQMTSTMECISNPVGGDYISTAVWEGFSLRDLLNEAGVMPGVVELELHAADDYVESLTLDEAMSEHAMVVHTMNGEPLPVLHGFPLRLIIPGLYGMKSVKWLTRINLIDKDAQGYWQEREWVDHAPVKTMSKISTPVDGQKVDIDKPRNVGGVAFSGVRGISKVEVSLDGGETWQEAELSEPLSPLTWRLWKVPLEMTGPGSIRLVVRATDGAGELQTSEEVDILPSGSTGWHRITFEVRDTT